MHFFLSGLRGLLWVCVALFILHTLYNRIQIHSLLQHLATEQKLLGVGVSPVTFEPSSTRFKLEVVI